MMNYKYTSDLTGHQLGQYEILERITKGSTSTIYKAYQPKLERYVAIKVLSPHVIDEEGFLERFVMEARAIAQLDHPNIVPVYDFECVGEIVYLVMKYVEGGTVKEMMTRGQPLDFGLTVNLTVQVSRALGYAHKRGVVHRDIKPSNILVAEGNWALLTDFGLVKMLASEKQITRTGTGMGTPDYMSPEQAQGFDLDHRTDLYSLGATVYEMVTGRVPFEAESSMAVVVKHMTEPPPPPRQLNPALPPSIEKVVLRAMEKDPEQRFQTAGDFADALVSAARPYLTRQRAREVDMAAPDISGVPAEPAAPQPAARPVPERRTPTPSRRRRTPSSPITARPRPALAPARRPFEALWSQKRYRFALAAIGAMIVVSLCIAAVAVWQVLGGGGATPAVEPTVTSQLPPTQLPATAAHTTTPGPTQTPSLPPSPAPSPVLSPTPLSLVVTLVPPDTPIGAAMYVLVAQPELALHREAGLDTEIIKTLPQDSLLRVIEHPVQAPDGLVWVHVRDLAAGIRGWVQQDGIVAYGLPGQ